MSLPFGRALFGILPLVILATALTGCSREPEAKAPAAASRPSAASSGPSAPQDPNAENPDKDSWVDLSTKPFEPKLVGGTFVQLRETLMRSLNAVARVGKSPDVEKLHKYLLGAPLLMEAPDFGPKGVEVVLHAAAKMPEESPDHLTQVWTLRPDLTWEDGKQVTARDYAFTFSLIRNPDVTSSIRGTYEEVDSIEELDALRFRVKWKSPQRAAIARIGVDFQVVPAHAVPADAASFNKTATHLACGPYRIVSFEPSKRLEIVLRDEYRSKPFPIRSHYVERFIFEPGSDSAASMARLLNRDAHLVGLSTDAYVTAASEPAFRAAAWRTHIELPYFSFIAWNLKDPADLSRPHPVLADLRVRQALAHLIPVQAISSNVFHGFNRPVSGPFDYRDVGTDPDIPPVAFDPRKAEALLREAGWAPGPDGRLAKDGRPCRLTLLRINSKQALHSLLPQAFQDEARKVGVTVDVEPREFGPLIQEMDAHKFDAGLVPWQLDLVEPDFAHQWHSRYAVSGGDNYSGFADPEVDRLIDAHESTFEADARAGLRRKLHRRIHDAAPVAFLLSSSATIAISRVFANVKIHDLGVRYGDIVLRELWEQYRPR